MMRGARAAVIVFCRPPKPGRVKTRLIGALSAAKAAAVHRACLLDTLAIVSGVRGVRKWLYVAGEHGEARRLGARLRLGSKWKVLTQRGKHLGERMRNAMEEQLRGGADKVVIVGTDSPWMGRETIESALRALERVEVVLGPSEDGGYYLVGGRRVVPEMFAGIRWGTAEVLSKTLRALRATRTKYRLLKRDFDLDRPEDLKKVEGIAARGELKAAALRKFLRAQPRRVGAAPL
jgi:rSAM/selenodomain-associated transferase 1